MLARIEKPTLVSGCSPIKEAILRNRPPDKLEKSDNREKKTNSLIPYYGVRMHSSQKKFEDEIELMDLLQILYRRKGFIVLTTLVFFTLALTILIVKYPSHFVTTTTLSLNFPGIEKHRNPDGTLFEENQIITPQILTEATAIFQTRNKEFPTENLRGMMRIDPLIPPEITEEMAKAEKEKKSYVFFPNQFRLSLSTEKNEILSPDERHLVLTNIVNEYRQEFNRKYLEEPLVTVSFPKDFLSVYDYPEIIETMKRRISNIVDMLNTKIKTAGFFRSKKSGTTFADIKHQVLLVKDIRLSEAEAISTAGRLSKNNSILISKYQTRVKRLELERAKKEAEALAATKLIKEMKQPGVYEAPSDMARESSNLILDKSIIKNIQENDYFSFLLKTALHADITAKNLEAEIKYYGDEIKHLQSKDNENKANLNSRTNNVAAMEGLFKEISGDIADFSQLANDVNIEYSKTILNDAVQIVVHPETLKVTSGSIRKISALSAMVGLFMSVLFAFFLEYITNHRDRVENDRGLKISSDDLIDKVGILKN